MHDAGALPSRVLVAGVGAIVLLNACGAAPPDAVSLLKASSQHMVGLKGFHFQMQIAGFTGSGVPVQSAAGDAHPPSLQAKVDLKQGGVLLEVEVIFAGGHIYLKSFTGGWQQLTPAEIAQFFDASALFDPTSGLFAAMQDTQSPARHKSETINGHDTYPVAGTVSATRMHQLLSLIRDQGSYQATYWIENPSDNLWRARLTGKLFDATQDATITFDFSNHDHPVSVTAPPLG
jgi:lipoprotein LprG